MKSIINTVFFIVLSFASAHLHAQAGCKYNGDFNAILSEVKSRNDNAPTEEDKLTDAEARKVAKYWALDCKCRRGVSSQQEAQALSNEAFLNTSNTFYKGFGMNQAKKDLGYLGDLKTPFAVFTPNDCMGGGGSYGSDFESNVNCTPEASRIKNLGGQLGAYASTFFMAYCKCKAGVSGQGEANALIAQMRTNYDNFNNMRNSATPPLSTQPLTSCNVASGGGGTTNGFADNANTAHRSSVDNTSINPYMEQVNAYNEQIRADQRALDNAADQTIQGWQEAVSEGKDGDFITPAKPLAEEFARQGSAAGAYGTIGVAVGAQAIAAISAASKERKAREAAYNFERDQGDAAFEKQQYTTALKWYQASFEKQKHTAYCAMYIGIMMSHGLTGQADHVTAAKYLSEAARLYRGLSDREFGGSAAFFFLSELYRNGWGVAKDKQKAFKLLKEASSRKSFYTYLNSIPGMYGLEDAEYWLAYSYLQGIGVSRNYREAFQLFSYMVSEWSSGAAGAFGLGIMYYYGLGLSKDLNKAVSNFKQAAKEGNSDALAMIKKILESGELSGSKADQLSAYYGKKLKDRYTSRLTHPTFGVFLKLN